MFLNIKNHIYTLVFAFFILNGCQLQEPSKNHGIVFLKNRSDKLTVNTTNKNDVLKILGQPHSKSIDNKNEWIYIERVLTKGKYHQLGKNILKSNNVLVLKFNKYGILDKKTLLNKDDKKNVNFSKKTTENKMTRKSFVEKFLSSVRTKMYGNK